MASFQQLYYCKKCKKNVSVDNKGNCSICGYSQIKKSWSVRFRYIEPSGQEVQKRLTGFQTKKEAQEAHFNFLNEERLKQPITTTDKLKFDILFEEYKNFAKGRLKESSYYDFCSKTELHILPFFKDYYVQDLTPKIFLEWQSTINHYSYKYKTNLRTYLNTILNYAEKYYDIPNKLRQVDNFRNIQLKKEMLIWTPEEFYSFIEFVDKAEYKAFFYALYFTGARKGEILATNWNDWDLENNTLNIDKTISKKVFDAPWLITSPKNQSSIRKISLPQLLVEVMKEYKKGKEDYEFVFADDKPLADTNIGRVQNDACNKSNVKKIRIHDFRHSHASLLLSKGVSIVAVSKRLGHSKIEQTLNTYAHLMPNINTSIAKNKNNSLNNISF